MQICDIKILFNYKQWHWSDKVEKNIFITCSSCDVRVLIDPRGIILIPTNYEQRIYMSTWVL